MIIASSDVFDPPWWGCKHELNSFSGQIAHKAAESGFSFYLASSVYRRMCAFAVLSFFGTELGEWMPLYF